MTLDELRRQVGAILAAEEREPTDWTEVKRLIDELEPQLDRRGECPEAVWHYLWDADLRAHNSAFAAEQREVVRRFVETGEYSNGTEVSPWTCALVAAGVGGLLFWLLIQ